jgi:hypothetical protein
MKGGLQLAPLGLALAFAVGTAAPVLAAEPAVVRTADELSSLMAKAPTPLDALTPFGRQEFLESLVWGSRGLGGLSVAPLLRELDRRQAQAGTCISFSRVPW